MTPPTFSQSTKLPLIFERPGWWSCTGFGGCYVFRHEDGRNLRKDWSPATRPHLRRFSRSSKRRILNVLAGGVARPLGVVTSSGTKIRRYLRRFATRARPHLGRFSRSSKAQPSSNVLAGGVAQPLGVVTSSGTKIAQSSKNCHPLRVRIFEDSADLRSAGASSNVLAGGVAQPLGVVTSPGTKIGGIFGKIRHTRTRSASSKDSADLGTAHLRNVLVG